MPHLLLILFLGSSLTRAQSTTLHIRVQEGELEKLSLNLPVSVISVLLPLVEDKVGYVTREHIEMGGQDFGIAELREIWNALKADGSYELANIQTGKENIRVLLDENSLLIDTDEASKEQVHVSTLDSCLEHHWAKSMCIEPPTVCSLRSVQSMNSPTILNL